MSYYILKIKKGNFELEIDSEDKYFIVSQFDKLCREEFEGAAKKKAKPSKKYAPTSKEEEKKPEAAPVVEIAVEEPTAPAVEEITKVITKPADVPRELTKKPEITEVIEEEPPSEEVTAPVVKEIQEPLEEKPKFLKKSADIQKEITEEPETAEIVEEVEQETSPEEETVSEEVITPVVEEVQEEVVKEKHKFIKKAADVPKELAEEPEVNDFQKIIEEKLKEDIASEESLEEDAETKETITYYEETEEPDEEEVEIAETLRDSFDKEDSPKKNSKVYDILQEKLSSLPEDEISRLNLNKTEVPKKSEAPLPTKFNKLDDLIVLKKPQTKLDYLLITAFFLQETEKQEEYSLKQINSKVVPLLKEPIDHSVIHEAVAHNYFEVVPDYTGASEITEYKITEEGVDYVLNEL